MTTSVSVFGLGYVGCVSAACFARDGHAVIGVDANPAKVEMINAGTATIVEAGIGELVSEMAASGRLRATMDPQEAVEQSRVSLICVGTPSRPNGSIDLSYVERVCAQIGQALRAKATRHTVVLRSTVLPGTLDTVVVPALEASSGRTAGRDFGVCVNPEFLREGTSIQDFDDPPFTLIGTDDCAAVEIVRSLYVGIDGAGIRVTAPRVAEMVKYVCNSFHGVKVAFANEVGNVCKALGVDSHEVMRLFCEDTKLNISAKYLRPGFAFGGSCLPKDLRAVLYRAKQLDVETPLLAATLESNRKQIARAYDMVLATGRRRVGVLGMSFKAGTDDLRESPVVALIEMLIGKGLNLAIYDGDVSRARLIGANREYIEREIPHIWSLMRGSVQEVLAHADVVLIGNNAPEFREIGHCLRKEQTVIDLVRALERGATAGVDYRGICW
jgi:GDP-mannose 6-dehydrogenase